MKSHNLEQIFPLSSANKSFDQYFSSTQLEFFGYIKYNLGHYGPLEKKRKHFKYYKYKEDATARRTTNKLFPYGFIKFKTTVSNHFSLALGLVLNISQFWELHITMMTSFTFVA